MSSESLAAPITSAPDSGVQVYRPTPDARRTALILLLGVAAIWLFAAWTLVTQAQDGLSGPEWVTAALMLGILLVAPIVGWTLLEERAATVTADATGLTYRSLNGINLTYRWPEITGLAAPPGPSRWARLFMDEPVMKPPSPTEEQSPPAGRMAEATTQDISSTAPQPVTRGDAQAGTPAQAEDRAQDAYDAEQRTIPIRVVPPPPTRITSPVIRALWRQAHGDTLPIPAGLADRAALVALIRAHSAPSESPPSPL
jgi:hypothetical protein